MAIRPSTPEIITVNSEDLQAQIRDLLPSQNGFGSELQASNVITPIIDLTPTAEGSILRSDLQTALAFGSQTVFAANNAQVTILNSPGFYRIFANITLEPRSSGSTTGLFGMTDGLSTKTIWASRIDSSTSQTPSVQNLDFVVFIGPGESVYAQGTVAEAWVQGSTRQIASADGTLVSPSGFPV